MVWAIGLEGTFRYLEYDWVCHPGEFITEFPGHAHTLVTDEPDGMKAFFWMQGANEFVTNIGDGWVKKNPAAKQTWDALVPVGRMAETYQIKPLALLLASDAGSYMTGAHVMIDGGMQLGPVKPLND